MVRPADALFNVPNAADVKVVFGAPQRTKLNGLDASTLRDDAKTTSQLRFDGVIPLGQRIVALES
jgi:hypothetical protein